MEENQKLLEEINENGEPVSVVEAVQDFIEDTVEDVIKENTNEGVADVEPTSNENILTIGDSKISESETLPDKSTESVEQQVTKDISADIKIATPEIFLAIAALVMVLWGAFYKEKNATTLIKKTSLVIFSAIFIYLIFSFNLSVVADKGTSAFDVAFFGAFLSNNFTIFLKAFISISAIIVIIISLNNNNYSVKESIGVFEFPVIVVLSVIGAFLLISANDFLIFYLGLELMSLASYVLVALRRDDAVASEAGVKYFILGALASGFILFGISILYGFSGTISIDIFDSLDLTTNKMHSLAVVFILSGLFFKLSAAPMHMWAPDVYEGSAKTVLSYISTIPKIAVVGFMVRLFDGVEQSFGDKISAIFVFTAILSLIIGGFAGLKQQNIQRLLAYSSISNIGFILIGFAVGNEAAYHYITIYLVIYILTSLGVFAFLSVMSNGKIEHSDISSLAGLSRTNPFYSLALAAFAFSLAGIPPLTGFFAKFSILLEAVKEGYYSLTVIAVVMSVVSCFYYLRIVKMMYFDEAPKNSARIINTKADILVKSVLILITIFSLLGFIALDKISSLMQVAFAG